MAEVMLIRGEREQNKILFLFSSIFFISSSIISFQILLQRFLSVVLTYHFVFIVVSIALFGISLGGLLGYFLNSSLKKYESLNILIIITCLFYIVLPVSYIFSIYAYNSNDIDKNIFIYSAIFIFPFIVGGFYSARLFYAFPEVCGQLYGTDLAGAAFGCIGTIYLLNRLDLTYALFVITALPLTILSFWMVKKQFAQERNKGPLLGLGAILVFAFLASFHVLNLPEISSGQNPEKEIYAALHNFNGEILESRDNALGRVDLIKFAEYPHLMDIYVDGTAGMPMYRFNGNFNDPNPAVAELKSEFPGYFPLDLIDGSAKDNALIIGPGGGRDILLAKMAGFQKITAVEVNPEIIRTVNNYSDFNGNIFNQQGVNLESGEGRSFLRADRHKYDMILFSLPVTNTSQSLGSFALTENYLYTSEAISEYLDHLSNEGHLIFITHNDLELLRLLTMTLNSFQEKNLSAAAAMQQLYVMGSEDYPVLVVSKQKIQKNEATELLKAAFNQTWFIPGSSFFPQVGFPFLNRMLLNMESNHATVDDLIREGDKRGYDLSPVTDESPFFYKLENSLPSSLVNVFYFSIGITAVFLSFPFLYFLGKKNKYSDKSVIKKYLVFSIYFSMIGTGFMILEVTMIQKFMLVLGNPIFSMSTIIFTMLMGAGFGSLTSSRFSLDELHKNLILICGLIVFLILFYQVSLSPILYSMSTVSIAFKTAISVILIFPLGFVMGFPFPMAIRLIKFFRMSESIPWMLAINGASSVFGSALTVVLAMTYGYGQALLAAAICYGIVFIAAFLLLREVRQGCSHGKRLDLSPP